MLKNHYTKTINWIRFGFMNMTQIGKLALILTFLGASTAAFAGWSSAGKQPKAAGATESSETAKTEGTTDGATPTPSPTPAPKH
jgi:hypothetical protein